MTVFVLNASRLAHIDRDPDEVFSRLHDPAELLGCVPGGTLTRAIDADSFEGRVVIGAGPFKLAYRGEGRIVDSDPAARTASLTLRGLAATHMPHVRIRMSMKVHGHPRGSEVQMSFRVTVADRIGLLKPGWVDPVAQDLLDKTVCRIKQHLETTSVGPDPVAA